MGITVDLHRQMSLKAHEVDDELINGELASELDAQPASPE
jgi:hypothetical protein